MRYAAAAPEIAHANAIIDRIGNARFAAGGAITTVVATSSIASSAPIVTIEIASAIQKSDVRNIAVVASRMIVAIAIANPA